MFDFMKIAEVGEQAKAFFQNAALVLDRMEQRMVRIETANAEILVLLKKQQETVTALVSKP